MSYRINGFGTTVSPTPDEGAYSIAMRWITIFYIPVIPLGFILIRGAGGNSYYILKHVTYSEAKKTLGVKGILLTVGYAFFIGAIFATVFLFIIFLVHYFR